MVLITKYISLTCFQAEIFKYHIDIGFLRDNLVNTVQAVIVVFVGVVWTDYVPFDFGRFENSSA